MRSLFWVADGCAFPRAPSFEDNVLRTGAAEFAGRVAGRGQGVRSKWGEGALCGDLFVTSVPFFGRAKRLRR